MCLCVSMLLTSFVSVNIAMGPDILFICFKIDQVCDMDIQPSCYNPHKLQKSEGTSTTILQLRACMCNITINYLERTQLVRSSHFYHRNKTCTYMTTNALSAVHDGNIQIHEQTSWQPLARHGTLVQSTQFHLFCLKATAGNLVILRS